jgi:hypothetical protein
VRSALDINISQASAQKLINTTINDDQIIINYDNNTSDTLAAADENNPLCLNSNYTIQSSRDVVDTKISTYNIATGISEDVNDFSIKTYADSGFMYYQDGSGTGVSLNSQIHNAGDK